MIQFYIFHDPELYKKMYDLNYIRSNYFNLLNKTANSFYNHCYFDNNSPYEIEGFYVATLEKNKVCIECIKDKDPQLINIMAFITAGKDYDAKLKKLNIGLDQLRKQIAVSDPNARKCPICLQKKVYHQNFDGYYGFKCNNCQIGYIGSLTFYYNGSTYTLEQAKKIYKMKAFK